MIGSRDRRRDGYHLYVCKACPWAHRAWLIMRLMGLEKAVSVNFVDPIRDGKGWAFRAGVGHGLDDVEGFEYLAEAYLASDPRLQWSHYGPGTMG